MFQPQHPATIPDRSIHAAAQPQAARCRVRQQAWPFEEPLLVEDRGVTPRSNLLLPDRLAGRLAATQYTAIVAAVNPTQVVISGLVYPEDWNYMRYLVPKGKRHQD